MSTPRALVFAVALAAVVLFGGLAAWSPPAVPVYQGKSLDYWLARSLQDNLSEAEQDEAQMAVTSIATNNLPLLLEWFRQPEPSNPTPACLRLIDQLLSRQSILRLRLGASYRPSRPSMAYSLFLDHPEIAALALPQFLGMVTDKDDTVKGKARTILNALGEVAP